MQGTVWIFGAGITGLTAAHELIERGFRVGVIECEEDPRHLATPAVGGIARTQWAVPMQPAGPDDPRPDDKMRPAAPLLHPIQLDFASDSIDRLTKEGAALFAKFVKDLRIYYEHAPPLRVIGNIDDRIEPTRKKALERARHIGRLLDNHGITSMISVGTLDDKIRRNPARAEIRIDERAQLPAEHGFRYFPAFYRHVFDTMGRIRLLDDHTTPTARPYRTVLDNLVPTQATNLAMQSPRTGFPVPREAPRSLREVQELVQALIKNAHYTVKDVELVTRKLLQYMTTGPKRRQAYEDKSWWEFMEGDRLSESCAKDANFAPQALVGMLAKECDARTQGNCVVQLLLNQLTGSRFSDATLNAPTTSAWLAPWRDYLRAMGVNFYLGELTGFKIVGQSILPEAKSESALPLWMPEDYFLLALSLPAIRALSPLFRECFQRLPALPDGTPPDYGDFAKLGRWLDGLLDWNMPENEQKGPLRHMTGIQFFFKYDVHPTVGHTLYLDAPWRLSSISPLSFWTRPQAPSDAYRGLISVDVGAWNAEGTEKRTAWKSNSDQIAEEVLRQIRTSVDLPQPQDYHIDRNIVFNSANGLPCENKAPYLVNRPREWNNRPGNPRKYRLAAEHWVLAGTFMQTYTRLTTMESANESARHAVNAVLSAANYRGAPCTIFNPEDHELRDLEALKALDDRLWDAGLPHALEIAEPPPLLSKILPFMI